MLPLENVKVLDLSQLGPGMLSTMILADFGAEVINICSPKMADAGNYKNLAEDPWSFEGQVKLTQESLNRNKKSMILDLKTRDDREIF